MDLFQAMKAFVRIVDTGSLTAAANSLDTSLPTVVRTLASLERHLGVSLLRRTTRRIHLTEEGTQYLKRCRDILSAMQEAEDVLVARRTEPVGKLMVTAWPCSVGAMLLRSCTTSSGAIQKSVPRRCSSIAW